MSIHQPIKLPVKLFSSTDTDAPQLTKKGASGEIKTILKACLITGYGDTEAQGSWAMPFEDGNKAVFKSTDPRATGFCFRIDHNNPKYGDIACYESMADVDTGTNEFFKISSGFSVRGRSVKGWYLLATSVSFVLLVENDLYGVTPLVFGDIMTTLNNDVGNCFISAVKNWGDGAYYQITSLVYSTYNVNKIARAYTGSQSGVTLSERTNLQDETSAYDGHIGYREFLWENGSIMRGVPPWLVSNKPAFLSPKVEVIGGRNYLLVSVGSTHKVFLIPTDYWLL